MPARQVRLVSALLLAAVLVTAILASAAKVYRAEQFDVRLEVQPDGSVRVTETIRFAFGPDSFTTVYREIPARRTDGIVYLDASMDGVPMSRGSGPGQFEVKNRNKGRRRAVFHFAPVTSSVHTFTLTYLASGVVRQDADADLLVWALLPTDHDYVIDRATAEVVYPSTTTLAGAPQFDPPAGVMSMDTAGVRASTSGFGDDDEWTVRARFAPRTLAAIPPRWQQRQALTLENLPLFLGLAGLILLTGVGGFVLFRLNNRPEYRDDSPARLTTPPDGLPVALAGAVTSSWVNVAWPHALGTLLDLARRGVVRVEEQRKDGLFKTRTFLIHRTGAHASLAAHEQTLLDLLFTTKTGPRDTVAFSDVTRAVSSPKGWKRFRTSVTADLRSAGLLDADRERMRSRVMRLGLVIVGTGIAALVACVPLLEQAGDTALLLPFALLAVGITGIVAGATLSTLSTAGQRCAREATGHRRYLEDLSTRPSPSSGVAAIFDRALPHAAAYGVAVRWAKQLEKQGVTTGPAWLGALAQDATHAQSHMAATVAMLSAGSNVGAQAGGAGAGGAAGAAAGGGASGAH